MQWCFVFAGHYRRGGLVHASGSVASTPVDSEAMKAADGVMRRVAAPSESDDLHPSSSRPRSDYKTENSEVIFLRAWMIPFQVAVYIIAARGPSVSSIGRVQPGKQRQPAKRHVLCFAQRWPKSPAHCPIHSLYYLSLCFMCAELHEFRREAPRGGWELAARLLGLCARYIGASGQVRLNDNICMSHIAGTFISQTLAQHTRVPAAEQAPPHSWDSAPRDPIQRIICLRFEITCTYSSPSSVSRRLSSPEQLHEAFTSAGVPLEMSDRQEPGETHHPEDT